MLEGLYTAAAGMAAQQTRLDALSNDVANVSTAGYKRVRIGFRDLLYQQDEPGSPRTGSGAAAVELGRDDNEGSLQQTGNPLDLAIEGDGYFQVRRANGQVALTRNGNFQIDSRGELVTSNGDRLVPPITLPRGADPRSVQISSRGVVTAGTRRIGQLNLVTVGAPNGLQPAGDSYFLPTAQSGPVRRVNAGTQLQAGVLEASDVDLSDVMVDMMDAQRSYSMASRAIHMQDQMWEVANGVKQ